MLFNNKSPFKILMVGRSHFSTRFGGIYYLSGDEVSTRVGSGKSSLLLAFADENFELSSFGPTDGVDFRMKELPEMSAKLQIWDSICYLLLLLILYSYFLILRLLFFNQKGLLLILYSYLIFFFFFSFGYSRWLRAILSFTISEFDFLLLFLIFFFFFFLALSRFFLI